MVVNQRFAALASVLVVLGVLLLPTAASAAKPRIAYALPEATHAGSMALAGDGAIWFVGSWGTSLEGGGAFVGRWSPVDGGLATFEVPEHVELGPPVTVGEDAWFTEVRYGEGWGSVGEAVEYSPTGEETRATIGTGLSYIRATTVSDGSLWFAATSRTGSRERGVIGRIPLSGDGTFKVIRLPRNCSAGALVAAQSSIWFAESCVLERSSGFVFEGSSIGRIAHSGRVTRDPIAKEDEPVSGTVGPNGTIWFGIDRDSGYSKKSHVIRIDPAGEIARFAVPDARLDSIAVGPKGRLWFKSSFGGQTFRALNSIGTGGHLGKPICVGPECDLETFGLLADSIGGLFFSAGGANFPGGGGVAGLLESESIRNQAGVIGRLGR